MNTTQPYSRSDMETNSDLFVFHPMLKSCQDSGSVYIPEKVRYAPVYEAIDNRFLIPKVCVQTLSYLFDQYPLLESVGCMKNYSEYYSFETAAFKCQLPTSVDEGIDLEGIIPEFSNEQGVVRYFVNNSFESVRYNKFDFSSHFPADILVDMSIRVVPYSNTECTVTVMFIWYDVYKHLDVNFIDESRESFVVEFDSAVCDSLVDYSSLFVDFDLHDIYLMIEDIEDDYIRTHLQPLERFKAEFTPVLESILEEDESVRVVPQGILSFLSPETEETFSDFIKEVQKMLPGITGTRENLDVVLEEITELLAKHDEAESSQFKTLFDQLREELGINAFKHNATKGMSLIALIAAMVYHHECPSPLSKGLLIAAVVGSLYYNREDVGKLLSYASSLFDFTPQGDDNFITGIVMCLFGMSFANCKTSALPSTVISALTNFERIEKSLSGIFNFVIDVIEKLVNYCVEDVHLPDSLRFFKIKQEFVREYIVRVDSLLDLVKRKDFPLIPSNFDILMSCIHDGIQLQMTVPRGDAGIQTVIQNHLMMLNRIRSEFNRAHTGGSGVRIEPTSAFMIGGPGVFKTIGLDHTINNVLPRILDGNELDLMKEDRKKLVYTREVSQEYYDGYSPSVKCVVFEDFLQAKDIAGPGPSDVKDFMGIMSCWDKTLHSASIEEKGNLFCKPYLVLATTNATHMRGVESISSSGALIRRFHFTVVCCPKDEYVSDATRGQDFMTRKFDISKLPLGEQGIPSVRPERSNYHEYNYDTANYTGRVFEWSEFCDLLVEHVELQKKRYMQYVSELQDTFNESLVSHPQANLVLSCNLPNKVLSNQIKCAFKLPDDDVTKCVRDVQKFVRESHFEGNEKPADSLEMMYRTFGTLALNSVFANSYTDEVKLYTMINAFGSRFCYQLSDGDLDAYVLAVQSIDMKFGPTIHPDHVGSFENFKCFFNDSIERARTYFDTKISQDLKSGLDFVKRNAVFIAAGFGFLSLVGLVPKLTQQKLEFTNPFCTQGDYQPKTKGSSVPKAKRTLAQVREAYKAQMGTSYDRSGHELVNKYMKKNVYKFYLRRKAKNILIGFVTFVKGTVIICPKHFATQIIGKVDAGLVDPTEQLLLVGICGPSSRQFTVLVKEFLANTYQTTNFDSLDLIMVDLPHNKVNQHTDLTRMFPLEKELLAKKILDMCLIAPHDNNYETYFGKARSIVDHPVQDATNGDYVIARGFIYEATTENGDCGSWFVSRDPTVIGSKLYGIHVAGSVSNSVGIATAISRENVLQCLEQIEGIIDDVLLNADFDAQGDFIYLDRFEKFADLEKPVFACSRTQITKSELYDKCGPATLRIARLSPFIDTNGILIDPYHKALLKVNIGYKHLDPEVLDHIISSQYDYLMRVSKVMVVPRLLTFEEAVAGIEDDPDFKGIALGKSPGYPYIHRSKGHSGKKLWFGEDGYDFKREEAREFRKEVFEYLDACKNNIRLPIYFTDNMKDETRPIAKVLSGSTRLFGGCNMLCLVPVRMYFGSFVLFMTKNRIFNGVALGVNPYSTEWTLVVEYMHAVGRRIGAGDFQGFDGSQLAQILNGILVLINKWYNDSAENQRIRSIMWLDVVNSTHVRGSSVYRWWGSLPSGHPLTPVINCLYNFFAFRYCWYRANHNDLASLWDFDTFVALIVLGDDNTFSTHPLFEDVFNEHTIPAFMSEINLTYTPEHKGVSSGVFRNIQEVEFLKRSFIKSPDSDRYLAPLRLSVILEMIYWTKKHKSFDITVDNVETCFRELALHGKDTFNKHVPIISEAMREYMGVSPYAQSFYYYYDKVIDMELTF